MTPRRTQINPASSSGGALPWRRIFSSLVTLALFSLLTLSLASAAGGPARRDHKTRRPAMLLPDSSAGKRFPCSSSSVRG
jgi:hypothetical protein